jgi:hypothetical protein
MILSPDTVLAYLGERDLVESTAAWTVHAAPSRNLNFSAAPQGGGPGFFLKQLRVMAPASVEMMRREATVYWLARNRPDFAGLQKLVPPFVLFDGALKVLVLGLVPGARNLLSHQEALGSFPIELGERLGEALALLHRGVGRQMRSSSESTPFSREVPGIFTAHRGGPLVRWLGPGQMRLIDRVREHPTLAPALDHLAATWSFDAFTHGDLKFENCVIPTGAAGGREIRIVDWELADFGDPCWDAGCIVQAYLYTCLRPFLARPVEPLWERFGRAADALGGFWGRYADGLEIKENSRAATLERVLGCAAARLIQMALEVMHGQGEPPPVSLSLLAAGAEVMADPLDAARRLGMLGMPASPTVSALSDAPRSGG